MLYPSLLHQYIIKGLGKNDVRHVECIGKQRGDFSVLESCYSTADPGYPELVFRMYLGVYYKIFYIGTDGFYSSLHGRYGVTLSGHSNACPPLRTESFVGQPGGSAPVMSCQIGTEDKYLTRLQRGNPVGSTFSGFHRSVSGYSSHSMRYKLRLPTASAGRKILQVAEKVPCLL